MPDLWRNVMNILIENGEISKTELYEKAFYYNKTKFWKYLEEWEKERRIEVRKDGKKQIVSLSSPEKKLREFVRDWGYRLVRYEKELEKKFTALEETLPIIDEKEPMIEVKSKQRALVLDKKDNIWKPTGKYEPDHSERTWKTRKKPTKHFEDILTLLNNLFQQSSVLTFRSNIIPELDVMNKYQNKSNQLIEQYTKRLEDMFRDTLDFAFVMFRIRSAMYAFVYRKTLETKMNSS